MPNRLAFVVAMMVGLGGCAELGAGMDIFMENACDDELKVRHARAVLFEKYSTQTVALDCDEDGKPDDLGTWTAPDAVASQ